MDFIARKDGKIEYYQVCQTLLSGGTMDREMRPLSKTGDNRPKTILTLDRFGLGDSGGIRILNLADWLMDSEL
ncbi:MAG: ATP-binding protein [Candidatus Methanomethylophilaceae archaeon]|nr:ATP-binding protein [Candidatus Methanomethylophilaceae archaeon]